MLNYSRIKIVAKEKGVRMETLAGVIDMSLSGMYASFANKTLTAERLVKICSELEISPMEIIDPNYILNKSVAFNDKEDLVKLIGECLVKLRLSRKTLAELQTIIEGNKSILKQMETEYQKVSETDYKNEMAYWNANKQLYPSVEEWEKNMPAKPPVSGALSIKLQSNIHQVFAIEKYITDVAFKGMEWKDFTTKSN